jgi:hypothetical protein
VKRTAALVAIAIAACKPEVASDPPREVTAKPDATAAAERAPPGPNLRVAQPVEMIGAANRLSELVKEGATDPKNAWMLAHGLLAFGKDMKAKDGRAAIDVIVGDFVEAHKTNGKVAYYSFPEKKNEIPVEPHRHMMIKKMLEAGVPLDRKFAPKSSKEKITLERLVSDAERTFVSPIAERDWRNFAWTMDALLRARGDKGEIEAGDKKYSLKEMALRTIHRIEEEQAFLVPALEANRPDQVEKKKQAIYGHTCGGLHLIQSGIHAAEYVNDPNATAAMKKQLALLLFRWDAERRIYRSYIAREPSFAPLLLIQELKFYGHLLEALAFAREDGLLEADPEMQKEVSWIAGDLLNTLDALEPVYTKARELEKVRPQSYYDLIGDGCHAIRGLRRSVMAFFPDFEIEKLQ